MQISLMMDRMWVFSDQAMENKRFVIKQKICWESMLVLSDELWIKSLWPYSQYALAHRQEWHVICFSSIVPLICLVSNSQEILHSRYLPNHWYLTIRSQPQNHRRACSPIFLYKNTKLEIFAPWHKFSHLKCCLVVVVFVFALFSQVIEQKRWIHCDLANMGRNQLTVQKSYLHFRYYFGYLSLLIVLECLGHSVGADLRL